MCSLEGCKAIEIVFWSPLKSIGINLYHVKKILLTGATGSVGNALITDLLSKTVDVMAFVRQSSAELPLAVGQVVVCDLAKASGIGPVTSIIIFLPLWEEGLNYLIIKHLNGLTS